MEDVDLFHRKDCSQIMNFFIRALTFRESWKRLYLALYVSDIGLYHPDNFSKVLKIVGLVRGH